MCDHVLNSHDHPVLKSSDITKRNLTLITLKALRVKESGPLRKPSNTALKYSDYGACLSHLDSCLAPVLSVLSVDKNRLGKTQIFYKTVLRTRLCEEVWERGVLNYGVKIVNS